MENEELLLDEESSILTLNDENGEPVRDAIVWLDNRAEKEAEIIEEHFGRKKVYDVTGQPEITATWPASIYLRLYVSCSLSLGSFTTEHTSFSIVGISQMRIKVLMVLNRVWSIERPNNAAVCDGVCSNAPFAAATTVNPSAAGSGTAKTVEVTNPVSFRKKGKVMRAHITPNMLNTVCASAALFEYLLPTAAAMFAVMVVPMFSPSTIAQAISNLIHPILSIIRVMAILALEDCSTRVRRVPKTRKMITDPKP